MCHPERAAERDGGESNGSERICVLVICSQCCITYCIQLVTHSAQIPRQARDDTEMIFQQSSLVRLGMTKRSVQLRAKKGSRKLCARRPQKRAAGLKILRACAGSRCVVRAVTSAAQGGSARFSRSVRRFCIAAAGFGRGCARQKAVFFLFLPLFARKRRIIPCANGKTNCMRAKFPIPAGGEVRTRDERESCFSERGAGEARRAERTEGKVR